MAVDFHEKESMLPSDLLTDDDVVSENQIINHSGSGLGAGSSSTESIQNWFSSCGSSDSPSSLSTPFGSELGSTETESDEDDFIAELTRQIADYMLQEDDGNENTTPNYASAKVPEWSDCNSGSKTHHGQRLPNTSPPNPSSVPAHVNVGFFSNDQIQAIQMENQQLKKQEGSPCWERRGKKTESTQHQKQQYMINRGIGCGFGNGGRVGPTSPQQAGSGMRAIFLGGSDSRSRPSGTGVFLPRGAANPQESRKKRGCSTVLIPDRVVQALNLHFDDMNAMSRSNGCAALTAHHLQRDGVMGRSNVDMQVEEKRHRPSQLRAAVNHQQEEMGLPQEWTY